MKKLSVKFVMIGLSAIVTLPFVGCGNIDSSASSSNSVVSESISKSNSTEYVDDTSVTTADAADIREQLDEINTKNDYIGSFVGLVWNKAGADSVIRYLKYFQSIESGEDFSADHRDIIEDCSHALDIYVTFESGKSYRENKEARDQFADVCIMYQNDLEDVPSAEEDVKAKLKALKDTDPDSFELLKDYYTETVSYTDFVSDPSGSYVSYSTQLEDYQTEIKTYQENLDLEL